MSYKLKNALKVLSDIAEDRTLDVDRRMTAARLILAGNGIDTTAPAVKKSARKRVHERSVEQELVEQAGIKRRKKRRARYLSQKTKELLDAAGSAAAVIDGEHGNDS